MTTTVIDFTTARLQTAIDIRAIESGHRHFVLYRTETGDRGTFHFKTADAAEFTGQELAKVPGLEVVSIGEYQVSKSALDGNSFVERADTPFLTSPRSETYWCS